MAIVSPTATGNWLLSGSGEFLLYGSALPNADGNRIDTIHAYYPNSGDTFVSRGDLVRGQPWSPVGSRVIFSYFEELPSGFSPGELSIADLETGSAEPLALEDAAKEFYWSPDGRYLLYREQGPGGIPWKGRLALYDVKMHAIEYLTPVASIIWIAGWSPDGSRVAYVSDANGNYDLYTFNIETLEYRQLTDDPALEVEVHWLPGRDVLIFGPLIGDRIPEEPPWAAGALYALDLQDSSRTLVSEGTFMVASVDPEGGRIAYGGQGAVLCLLDLKTGEEDCDLLGEHENDFSSYRSTAWSADGTKLAFRAVMQGTLCAKTHVLVLQTGELRAFDEGCYRGSSPPSWSRGAP